MNEEQEMASFDIDWTTHFSVSHNQWAMWLVILTS